MDCKANSFEVGVTLRIDPRSRAVHLTKWSSALMPAIVRKESKVECKQKSSESRGFSEYSGTCPTCFHAAEPEFCTGFTGARPATVLQSNLPRFFGFLKNM